MFIKSPSGRNRFNVLGALNAITHELIMITNDKYIIAFSFCELLWDISCRYANSAIPITLVLNNARYQKCKLVFYFAKLLDIELLYLPSYSPNLNLIERLRKGYFPVGFSLGRHLKNKNQNAVNHKRRQFVFEFFRIPRIWYFGQPF